MTDLGQNFPRAHYTIFQGTKLSLALQYDLGGGSYKSFTDYDLSGTIKDNAGNSIVALSFAKSGSLDTVVTASLGAGDCPAAGVYYATILAENQNDADDVLCLVYLKLTITQNPK